MKSVAILGCGPSGLLVAHAAEMCGWDFRIYSRKQKSPLHGAQYLHQAIPELDCGTPQMVTYRLNGSPEQYRHKVYGPTWDGTVSPEDYWEAHYAWDIRSAYDQMWFKYEDQIEEVNFHSGWNDSYEFALGNNDLVISTVPRTIWDSDNSHFERTTIWALGDTDMPRVDPAYRPAPFTVYCEGDHRVPWYRVSNIFGYCTVEWPDGDYAYGAIAAKYPNMHPHPPAEGASRVTKPLRYTGNAAPDFVHLGRYGAWQKGVLTSDVFFEAMKVLSNDKIE